MKSFLIALLLSLFTVTAVKSQVVVKIGKDYAFGDRVVVKFESTSLAKAALSNSTLAKVIKSFGITSIEPRFKIKKDGLQKNTGNGLEKIMTLKYTSPINPEYLAAKLSKLPGVEWAEPYYLGQIMFTPNDPRLSEQYALRKIKASEAWEISKGDTNVIIAINDTGVDWDHPDLAENIWTNKGEIPNNGVDDDNNGYIDDVHGWDFGGTTGTPDNDPHEDRPDHGTHVAGIASAVTNNNVGIASIGFNCKIMPVKTSQDNIRDSYGNPLISYGYQGIIYAVDNGAKVINTSWGSYSYSNVGQEVIDYAVEHGTLIVGAAGNETNPESIYPGAYRGALSVGAVDSSDVIAYFSNYGKRVDVFAPGVRILSTWQNDTYTDNLSGTSMASPFVAGLAGLVASNFPSYSPEQIAQQIRVTADNIDAINAAKYNYLLGSGRINAYAALSKNNAEAVRTVKVEFVDEGDGDGIFERGEKLSVKINFKNILNSTSALKIDLLPQSGYVTMSNGTFNAGAVSGSTEFNNYAEPFSFTISNDVPENEELNFLIKYEDTDYSDFEWVSVVVNPTYLTQKGNNIALTFTSKGTMGFNDYPNNTEGDGFTYKNSANLLFEGALIYGTGVKKIDNAARNSTGEKQDADFTSVKPFFVKTPGLLADVQGQSVFNDFHTFGTRLQIQTTMNTYSYSDEDKSDFIIVQYLFKNTTGTDINGFRAGIFFDWDMDATTYDDNITDYDSQGGFGYAYSYSKSATDAYVTCALVSRGNYSFYGIQNDGNDGGINIYDGFSDEEKWLTLTNGIAKVKAGPQDISFVAGAGPFTIPAYDSIDVAFAIAAGESVDSLRNAVAVAKSIYDSALTAVSEKQNNEIPVKFYLSQNYPNPFSKEANGKAVTTIKYSIPSMSNIKGAYSALQNVSLKVYDVLGREVATLVNKVQSPGNYSVNFDASALSSGIYFYRLSVGSKVSIKKMILLR